MLVLALIGTAMIGTSLESENGKPKIASHRRFWFGVFWVLAWIGKETMSIIF